MKDSDFRFISLLSYYAFANYLLLIALFSMYYFNHLHSKLNVKINMNSIICMDVTTILSDIEILVAADVFIGSHSNVYAMAASLRLSKHYPEKPLNHTCLIDHRLQDLQMHCEGSDVARQFWSSAFIDLGFSAVNDSITYWPAE